MKRNVVLEGGPAFPETHEHCAGMTMREYYAGQALAGLLVSRDVIEIAKQIESVAGLCWALADAMMKAKDNERTD